MYADRFREEDAAAAAAAPPPLIYLADGVDVLRFFNGKLLHPLVLIRALGVLTGNTALGGGLEHLVGLFYFFSDGSLRISVRFRTGNLCASAVLPPGIAGEFVAADTEPLTATNWLNDGVVGAGTGRRLMFPPAGDQGGAVINNNGFSPVRATFKANIHHVMHGLMLCVVAPAAATERSSTAQAMRRMFHNAYIKQAQLQQQQLQQQRLQNTSNNNNNNNQFGVVPPAAHSHAAAGALAQFQQQGGAAAANNHSNTSSNGAVLGQSHFHDLQAPTPIFRFKPDDETGSLQLQMELASQSSRISADVCVFDMSDEGPPALAPRGAAAFDAERAAAAAAQVRLLQLQQQHPGGAGTAAVAMMTTMQPPHPKAQQQQEFQEPPRIKQEPGTESAPPAVPKQQQQQQQLASSKLVGPAVAPSSNGSSIATAKKQQQKQPKRNLHYFGQQDTFLFDQHRVVNAICIKRDVIADALLYLERMDCDQVKLEFRNEFVDVAGSNNDFFASQINATHRGGPAGGDGVLFRNKRQQQSPMLVLHFLGSPSSVSHVKIPLNEQTAYDLAECFVHNETEDGQATFLAHHIGLAFGIAAAGKKGPGGAQQGQQQQRNQHQQQQQQQQNAFGFSPLSFAQQMQESGQRVPPEAPLERVLMELNEARLLRITHENGAGLEVQFILQPMARKEG